MNGHVLVTFLETTVFAYVVQVITTNDNGTLHLQFLNGAGKDAATDAYITSEWAFVVDVSAIDCLKEDERSEKKTLTFIHSSSTVSRQANCLPLLVS